MREIGVLEALKKDKLLCTGAVGTTVAVICCFTPALVALVVAVGLSAWVGWLDYVLFPALAFFVALTGFALYRRSKEAAPGDERAGSSE